MGAPMIGESNAMKRIKEHAVLLGRSKMPVLIQGETGTGKDVLARFIHRQGDRNNRPFVKVNCSALPESLIESELFGHTKGAFTGALYEKTGRFELANGGTLFLDEIGELTPFVQPKLLNVLEDELIEKVGGIKPIPVDFRLISATHVDLASAVRKKAFRQDLYYRIQADVISVPPLRDRKEDIPFLINGAVHKFTDGIGLTKTISKGAIARLMQYDYPGNVRELQNIVQRLLLFSPGKEVLVSDVERTLQTDTGGFPDCSGEDAATLHYSVLLDDVKKIRLVKSDDLDALWHESLRKVKAQTFIDFFRKQGSTPFSPNEFHEFMSLRARGGISYKQCGFYLSVLKTFDICGHNDLHANRKRYHLSERYLAGE